ncbi:MAG: RecQ family ATP-dependent DNA helicase [Bacteroidales bacterium]|nr:RecQ family ATP-dependent DNA helicase [Bacteroidales bacterium]
MSPHEVLKKHWGYSDFRPLQEDIIRSVLEGKDTLGLLPTGGGKSICYQVPGIITDGLCVVITPLIALMKDQVEGLTKRGIAAKALFSGMHRNDQEVVINNAVNDMLKFLFISPERLQSRDFLDSFREMKVRLFAVDEAHCISQWGYDFRPPYLKIADARQYHPTAPVLALTATATPEVVDDIQQRLGFKKKNVFQKSFERKNLAYIVIFDENKNKKLMEIIKKTPGSGIVYVRSRRKTETFAAYLTEQGVPADFYHAGLDVADRDRKQNAWMCGKTRVIVATNAFGMGIDKPDVRFVIHLDVPDSPEAYFQEAGRAGRDEKTAYAILLYENSDIIDLERRLKESFPPPATIKNIYNALGNYFNIPLHSGRDQSFDFDIYHFIKNYPAFSFSEVWNSLKFLEREGYIIATEQSNEPAKLMFQTNHHELYKFQIENQRFDAFIRSLLRTYTGVFSDFVSVRISVIAEANKIGEGEVVSLLQELEKQQVLWFQPQKDKPQIIYTCERLSERDITLSKETYQERKESAQKRVAAMKNYVADGNACRSAMLLQWFGQTNAPVCHSCDVCRKRNEITIAPELFQQTSDYITLLLQKRPLTGDEICALIPAVRSEKVLKIIRFMVEHGEIYSANGKYQIKKK